MKIEWKDGPIYDHSGRWVKKYQSIMNPEEKVTWPQLIAEFVIFFRQKYIKTFPKINKGKGWSQIIQKQVRELNQQATAICNYFPHPDDEPLVVYAVKKYFREQKPFKIGRFRKNRISKTGKLTITQDEKDVVLGINTELIRVIKSRESYNQVKVKAETEVVGEPTFNTQSSPLKKRGSLAYLLELEKQINEQEVHKEDNG